MLSRFVSSFLVSFFATKKRLAARERGCEGKFEVQGVPTYHIRLIIERNGVEPYCPNIKYSYK